MLEDLGGRVQYVAASVLGRWPSRSSVFFFEMFPESL